VAAAVEALESEQVQRLVLVRPAVEAGERLGFLPGDMMQKVDPYLRPIYDALYEFLGIERRIGFGSKAIVTGDVTQVDLPKHQLSGLKHVQTVLGGVDGVGFCKFTSADVVRHPLVQRIVAAYESAEAVAEKQAGQMGQSSD